MCECTERANADEGEPSIVVEKAASERKSRQPQRRVDVKTQLKSQEIYEFNYHRLRIPNSKRIRILYEYMFYRRCSRFTFEITQVTHDYFELRVLNHSEETGSRFEILFSRIGGGVGGAEKI